MKNFVICGQLDTTKTAILRLYQIYGENQRKDTALAAFIRSKKLGKPITLTETTAQSSFRTGRRDFIYVKDVAKAFLATMVSEKTGNGEVINIGTGKCTTMEQIANVIGGEVTFIPKEILKLKLINKYGKMLQINKLET